MEKRGSPCRLKTLNCNNPPEWKAGLNPPSAVSCAHCFVCSYSSRSGSLLQVKRMVWEHLRPGTGNESLSLAFHNCPPGRLSSQPQINADEKSQRAWRPLFSHQLSAVSLQLRNHYCLLHIAFCSLLTLCYSLTEADSRLPIYVWMILWRGNTWGYAAGRTIARATPSFCVPLSVEAKRVQQQQPNNKEEGPPRPLDKEATTGGEHRDFDKDSPPHPF